MNDDKKTERPLTIKQRRFAEAIASPETKSQAEAARKAGYSENIVYEVGSENLRKPNIVRAVEIRKAEESDKARDAISRFERQADRFGKLLEAVDADDVPLPLVMGTLESLQRLKANELELREKYGIDRSDDPAAQRAQARSLQKLIYISIRCAIERPATARRILERCEATFSTEPEAPERTPARGWDPTGFRDV